MTTRSPEAPAGTGGHTLAVLAACVLWGTTGTVAHHAPAGADQTAIGVGTFGLGALLLLVLDVRAVTAVLRRRGGDRVRLVAGALGVLMYASMYYTSMDLVGVAVGNVLALGSGPVFAALLELVLDRRPVGTAWLVATAVAVCGIVALALGAQAAPGRSPLLGVLLGLGGGFGYALYSWCAAGLITAGVPSRAAMASVFALAAVVLLPWFAMTAGGPLRSGNGILVMAYLAILPMAVAYLLFGYGLRALPASTATTLALAEPLVATMLAVLVLHEHLGLLSWLGLGLIVVGIVLVARAERGSGAQAPPAPLPPEPTG